MKDFFARYIVAIVIAVLVGSAAGTVNYLAGEEWMRMDAPNTTIWARVKGRPDFARRYLEEQRQELLAEYQEMLAEWPAPEEAEMKALREEVERRIEKTEKSSAVGPCHRNGLWDLEYCNDMPDPILESAAYALNILWLFPLISLIVWSFKRVFRKKEA
jgi:hypothetical protein